MRYKILIVDDEPGITDMIREYFEPEYEVYTADSGEEAIKKLSVKPDLISICQRWTAWRSAGKSADLSPAPFCF